MNAAGQRVLTWCRKQPVGCGIPCMRRDERTGLCVVVDNSRFSSPILAAGLDWFTVEAHLVATGLYARESAKPVRVEEPPMRRYARRGRRY